MVEPFLGEIDTVGFNFAPRGWALCDNQLLSIAQNTALFSLLGTTYGGDGRTTFALPALRGRYPRGVGTGAGLDTVSQGQRQGAEEVLIMVNNLPAHNHTVTIKGDKNPPDTANPNNAVFASGNIYHTSEEPDKSMDSRTAVCANTGGSYPMSFLNPFLGIYYCVALQGIYPSRS